MLNYNNNSKHLSKKSPMNKYMQNRYWNSDTDNDCDNDGEGDDDAEKKENTNIKLTLYNPFTAMTS